jgi:sugar-phosphatase
MTTPERANAHRTLLFDVDGVLLDGQSVYEAGWEAWAVGRGLDPVVVTGAMHGRRPEETIATVAPHLDVAEERRALTASLAALPPIPAMAGAIELLGSLPAGRWAIVTSSREGHIRRCFEAAGLPLPAVAVFADDVERGKPDPEGYLRAAAALGAAPGECVVVEDSPAGVAAGKAAGCTVVALATTHAPGELSAADELFASLDAATPWLQRASASIA